MNTYRLIGTSKIMKDEIVINVKSDQALLNMNQAGLHDILMAAGEWLYGRDSHTEYVNHWSPIITATDLKISVKVI